ncbi:MAG: hypothetical protein ABEI31_11265 [Halodesulfurarchaeum sp.]
MRLTEAAVIDQHTWVRERASTVVPLINDVRDHLGAVFGTEVRTVERAAYQDAVDEVFDDGARGVNVAALVWILRELDVENDYPGFVVDEILGRELAGTIAGGQPRGLLAEATFHVADIHVHEGRMAGADDLDAALAAGFQTRLPGWSWTQHEPFAGGE